MAGADLRLLPVAAVVWLVTFVGLASSTRLSVAVAACTGLPVVPLLWWGRRWCRIVALALGGAAVAAVLVGYRVHLREASPLWSLAGERSKATLWLVVNGDPRPIRPRPTDAERRVALPARVIAVAARGHRWREQDEVLVLAPANGWRELLPSQHLRAQGRLRRPLGSDLTVAVLTARGPPGEVGPPSWPQRVSARLRGGLRAAAGVLPTDERGLLPGLVLGDTTQLEPTVAADFRTAGMTHLLAVSGSNLSILLCAVLFAARWSHLDPRVSATVAGLVLVGFVVLVRPSPSVLRAAAMGMIGLVALATGRPRAGLPALAGTVLVLVLVSPALARSIGFALSVLATGGLLVVAPVLVRTLSGRGMPLVVAHALAVPLAAHLATAPLVAALSGQVGLAAVPANLLAAPAVAPVTVLGVLATLAAPVSMPVAEVLARVAGLPTAWLVAVARRAADTPLATLPWPSGDRGAWLLAGALVVVVLAMRHRTARWSALVLAVGAVLVVVPNRIMPNRWPPPGWLMVACDVGQGDALVLNAGGGNAVVVDAGPDPPQVDSCLRRLDVRRVPLVLLTHLHADHTGGLSGVLRGRQVGVVEVGPLEEPAWGWAEVRKSAGDHRFAVRHLGAGETLDVSGVRLDVIAPAAAFHGTRSDPNNSSLVVRATVGGHRLLLTGDVEVEAQQAILATGADLAAEVLKVPHHGSPYSDRRFLESTHARVAVISVGEDNDYGHPAPSLVAELSGLGMRVYRTDLAGDVAVVDVGGRLAVATDPT